MGTLAVMKPSISELGMTLIEIVLVLALVAMCARWSLHGWQQYQQVLRLVDSAQQLRHFLTQQQRVANWYNHNRLLWVIPGVSGCVGMGVRPPRCSQASSGYFMIKAPDVVLSDFTDKTLGFYGVRNTAQAGHILLESPAGRVRVILSSHGRIRLCSERQPLPGAVLCG
jgi:prepilin peptidase dependent protein A